MDRIGMKHIRGITLDLDDTLWDIWSVIRRAEVELHRHIESALPQGRQPL